jgi:hypothetical protein
MVPVVGSPLAVAFAMAMGWSYNRRMHDWLESLAEAVEELQERTEGLSFEDLAGDEVFTDAVVNASRAAQATHDQEKLRALRNGVLNSLGPQAPVVDEQHRFFRLVEQFTAGHLRLLGFLDDPEGTLNRAGVKPPNVAMGGRGSVLEHLPEFKGQRDWYDLLMGDLAAAGLHNGSGLHVMMSGSGVYQSSTSALGKRFLRFISDPPALE